MADLDRRALLTPQDVAVRLAVSRSMVYALIRKGLPAVYVGRLPRIEPAALDAWIERQRESRE